MQNLEYLRPFVETPRQSEYLDAIIESGDGFASDKAAEIAGITRRPIQRAFQRMKERSALKGVSNDSVLSDPIAEGFSVSGMSTLYDEAGDVKIQWIKQNLDQKNKINDLIEALTDTFSEFKAKSEPVTLKTTTFDSDLLTVYPMGDPHIGLYNELSRLENELEDLENE